MLHFPVSSPLFLFSLFPLSPPPGNHGNPRDVAVQLDHLEIIKIIDSTNKDASEMLLKKSVDCFSSFYGQQETRSLEKKKEEVVALVSSAEKGPGIIRRRGEGGGGIFLMILLRIKRQIHFYCFFND